MRVAVAMSGGVDSLRAAALLKEEGHDVFALHMRLPPPFIKAGKQGDAPWEEEQASLKDLTSKLSIPLLFVDVRKEFEDQVITPFLKDYERGLTPNPCFICNSKIKFGALWKEARRHGAQRLATGHYARTLPAGGLHPRHQLLRGLDRSKDQSYFLALLSQDQLSISIFPLGGERKKNVRLWAEHANFSEHLRKESQEICFIPEGNYREYLQERLPMPCEGNPGPIVDMAGNRLGEHRGLFAYTVGQRRGLGIPSHAPYYVVELDPRSNTLRVGRDQDLFKSQFTVLQINWVAMDPPSKAFEALVQIRYRHEGAPARIIPFGETGAVVCFKSPQRAVTPGQAAVFYQGDQVLGGGVIRREHKGESPAHW